MRTHLSTVLSCFLFLAPVHALAEQGDCGQPATSGADPKTADALAVLRAAVGAAPCLPCICDVDISGKVTAPDALITLRKAVGHAVTLRCVACPVTETIGSAGGVIVSDDGVIELTFPPGALDGDTSITISGQAPSLREDLEDFPIDRAYLIEPQGLELNEPAELAVDVFRSREDDGTVSFDVVTVFGAEASSAAASARGAEFPPFLPGVTTVKGIHFGPSYAKRQSGMGILGGVALLQVSEGYVRVPSPVEVGGVDNVTLHLVATLADVFEYKGSYSDPVAVDFEPVGGAPYSSGLVLFSGKTLDLETAYTCGKSGFASYSATSQVVRTRAGADSELDHLSFETDVECESNSNVLEIPRADLEDAHRFRGPFATVPTPDLLLAIGVLDGSIVYNLDTREIEIDFDDQVSEGHYGGIPLKMCDGMCKYGWVQYGPATGGISVWNFNAGSFGNPVITGGPFNGYDDAMPVLQDDDGFAAAGTAQDGISDTVYAANTAAAKIDKVGYDSMTGTFKMLGSIVNSGWGPSQNPGSVFPFPNGAMVITGLGNASSIQSKLYFHPGNNPATPVTPIGDIGLYSRRVRCAQCNGGSNYTCLSSALFSSQLHVSQVNAETGAGSVTDDQPTGQGPNGVAIFPKLTAPGCFGVVTNYGGGGYMLCDIGLNGQASCQNMALPAECPDARFVVALEDNSFVILCERQESALLIPAPAE